MLVPIKMTSYAAENITSASNKEGEPRPHVHDTAGRLARALGAKIKCIIINKCHKGVFYSYIRLVKNNKTRDVDARPSDSMSIALRFNVPILIKKCVYEKSGIKITKELLEKSTSI